MFGIQKISVGWLGFHNGVIFPALQLLDRDHAVLVGLEIAQILSVFGSSALVQFEHSILQAITIRGVHLFDGETCPRLVAEFYGDGLTVPLRDIHGMDSSCPLVILGRGHFLHPVLAGDEVGKDRFPIGTGRFCKALPGLEGRGVGAQEGRLDRRPRQQLTGLGVLFQHDQLGLFVVGDIQDLLLPFGNGDIIGRLGVQHIPCRCGQLLYDQRPGIRQGDVDLAVGVGGLCPGLGGNAGVSIPDTEGCTLQCNALIAGFVFVDREGAGHGNIHKGHRRFPVPFNKVCKLLHLGVTVGLCAGGRAGLRYHLTALNVDDGGGGGFCYDGDSPSLHMGDAGISGGHHRSLGFGVHQVAARGPHLPDGNGGRVMVVFGVRPGKEPRPVVHLPAFDGSMRAIGKGHINIE